ncbi:MAG: zinc dependent phospholipase C family protein [Bacteroidia bacterium]|nr:zinc dependent phospholipase C family protein [Bacteroidia bacterium]
MKVFSKILFLLFCLCINSSHSYAWGFFAHKKINELAVFTLPPEMFGFYKLNIEFIAEHAPDPDNRRYAIAEEGARHFLDADRYENALPFDTIPQKWEDAVAMFTEDTLQKHGIVPWHLELMVKRLTYSFKNRDLYKIIRYSVDIGHYVGDLNVPLHTTSNYNGQLTNQHGIHALWESRLPELFSSGYDFLVGKAKYIEDVRQCIWMHFAESHSLVDSVLNVERSVSQQFSEEEKYSFEQRGASTVRVYSQTFSKAYHKALGSMVEDRMKSAIKLLGDIWFTAWVNAGQPDLNEYKQKIQLDEEELKELQEIKMKVKDGKIKGRPEPTE